MPSSCETPPVAAYVSVVLKHNRRGLDDYYEFTTSEEKGIVIDELEKSHFIFHFIGSQ